VLQKVKFERNTLQTIKGKEAKFIGHILRNNCLLKHVTEGQIRRRIDVTGRRERRCKQLLDDLFGKESIVGTEIVSTSSYSLNNSLWKRPWNCLKTTECIL